MTAMLPYAENTSAKLFVTDLRTADLLTPLANGSVVLEPLADHHIPALKEACSADREVWEIYPMDFGPDGFDLAIGVIRASSDFHSFAVIENEKGNVVGMSSYIRPTMFGVVEVGGTYIHPQVRGSSFNRMMKKLMIEHAFECGFHKIEFRVDTRNARSMAAVLKLGAQQEGVLRQNMVTWTGYRRDTAVFGLLRSEWTG